MFVQQSYIIMLTFLVWFSLCDNAWALDDSEISGSSSDPSEDSSEGSSDDVASEDESTSSEAVETPEERRAKALYESAKVLYDEARFAEAIEAFSRSYEISQDHKVLDEIATAYERMGNYEEAIKTLSKYRQLASEEQKPVLRRRIDQLVKLQEQVRPEKEEEAERESGKRSFGCHDGRGGDHLGQQ